jgi:hypothetical protein
MMERATFKQPIERVKFVQPYITPRKPRKQQAKIDRPEVFVQDTFVDPVGFCRNALRIDPWAKQEAIIRAINTNRRVAVRACHASGKSLIAAATVLWWLARWPGEGSVVTTASSWLQVKNVLWREIHRLKARSIIDWPAGSQTELRISENNLAFGISTNDPTRFQGLHTPHVLVILDEATGIGPEIWQAALSLLSSGDSRLLVLGNPTSAEGPFFDIFEKGEGWVKLAISAFEMPTMSGLKPGDTECKHGNTKVCKQCGRDGDKWGFLCSVDWVNEQLHDWGTEHPFWVTRVLGEFSTDDAHSMFPLTAVTKAELPCSHDHTKDDLVAGIDVAAGGADDTIVQICSGWCRIAGQRFGEKDPYGAVVNFLNKWNTRIREVRVDVTGVGAHFANHLAQDGWPVQYIHPGGGSNNPDRYLNRRAEMYEKASKALRDGHCSNLGPTRVIDSRDAEELKAQGIEQIAFNDKTAGELIQIRHEFANRGQIKIESKEDLKARGYKSPDYADAYVMAGSDPMSQREIEMQFLAKAFGVTPNVPDHDPGYAIPSDAPDSFQRHFSVGDSSVPGSRLMQVYLNARKKFGLPQ